MHKCTITLMTATALIAGATFLSRSALATAINESSIQNSASNINNVVKVQFYWGGRRYCWYDDGWRGPGFYWCGYARRQGFGWGGGWGWHGWSGGHGYHGPAPGHHGPGPGHHGPGPGRHHGAGPGAVFFDIRLKEDIVPLVHLANGVELYRFRYKWSDRRFVGVMAQQVEPKAVYRGGDGYLRVKYDKLGVGINDLGHLVGADCGTLDGVMASPRQHFAERQRILRVR